MTRANIVRNIINDDGYYYTKHSVLEIVNVIFDEHEAQLREAMKPKTCEGCVYEDKDDGFLKVECVFCLRNSNDNFEPKEQ